MERRAVGSCLTIGFVTIDQRIAVRPSLGPLSHHRTVNSRADVVASP
jgi:hypothetical protein